MDVSSGFYNFRIDERDKHKTAFVTEDNVYQFIRLGMGLKNSPAFFSRILKKIFRSLLFKSCFLYRDDVLVYTSNFSDHLKELEKVFNIF